MGINWAVLGGTAATGIGEANKKYADAAGSLLADTSKLRLGMEELGLHKERLALDASQIRSMNDARAVDTAIKTASHESMMSRWDPSVIGVGVQNPTVAPPAYQNPIQQSSVQSENIGPAPGQKVAFDTAGASKEDQAALLSYMSNNYPNGINTPGQNPSGVSLTPEAIQEVKQKMAVKVEEEKVMSVPHPVAEIQKVFKEYPNAWEATQKAAASFVRTAPDGTKYVTGYDMKAFSEMLAVNKAVRLNLIQATTADAAKNYSNALALFEETAGKYKDIAGNHTKLKEKEKLEQTLQIQQADVMKWKAQWQGGLQQQASLEPELAKTVLHGMYAPSGTLTYDQRVSLKNLDNTNTTTRMQSLMKDRQAWDDKHSMYTIRYEKNGKPAPEENLQGIDAFNKRNAELALDKTITNKKSGKMGVLGAVNPYDAIIAAIGMGNIAPPAD